MKRICKQPRPITHIIISLAFCCFSIPAISQLCSDTVKITYSPIIICPAATVAFVAHVPAGSTNPHFQWVYNGAYVSSDVSTYTTNSLKTGDIIKCIFKGVNCQGSSIVSTDSIIVTISPVSKPSISISTAATYICKGSSVAFFATAQNGGPHPSYQWKVDGISAGANSDTFYTSSLKNGDVVSCMLTVDPALPCSIPKIASSYGISMTVTDSPPPSVTISVSANDICPGTPVTFAAAAQNAGSALFYQWVLNNADTGTDSANFTCNNLTNGDEIFCLITDSAGCSRVPTPSEKILMSVKSLPEIVISPLDTMVAPGAQVTLNANVSGSLASYQWLPAQNFVSASSLSPVTQPVNANTNYFFNAITTDGCTVSKEIIVRILINLIMPNAFTPNGDGRNEIFRIPANTYINLHEFAVFDRWGNKIFSTTNSSHGWDGTVNGKKQDAGVYIYVISGSDKNGKVAYKGSFMLIR